MKRRGEASQSLAEGDDTHYQLRVSGTHSLCHRPLAYNSSIVSIQVSPQQGFRHIRPAFPEGVCNDEVNLIAVINALKRRGVCAENLAAATPVSKRKTAHTPMVDDTMSEILKHKPDEEYRRLQQGFEAFRPAFLCNYKVNRRESTIETGSRTCRGESASYSQTQGCPLNFSGNLP